MKHEPTIGSYEIELEQIDPVALEHARGGMDPANQSFLWASLAGIGAFLADRALFGKVRIP